MNVVCRYSVLFCWVASSTLGQSASDFYPAIPAAQEAYIAYSVSETCDGPELARLLEIMDSRVAFAKASLATDELGVTSDGYEIANKTGLAYVALGDLALSRGCLGEARGFYILVIETFTGEAFGALRQRAMIGIDDIRAKS